MHSLKLESMILELINGNWSVQEFEKNYYYYYLDEVPSEAFSETQLDFFSAVQENLDWTDLNPDSESRACGWCDHKQYVLWLKSSYKAFKANKKFQIKWS